MKKLLLVVTAIMLAVALTACQPEEKTLSVYFVPSRDAAEILTATEPLKQLLKDELAELGYDFDEIIIEVGTTYEAVGEAMVSGTADIGFLPGGTYVLYAEDGEVDVALTATRAGLTKDDPMAMEWNDGLPTEGDSENQVTYYRGLILAGPSAKGMELAAKVNAGTALTWEDLNSAQWCVRSSTSSSGFIYPTIWLMNKFNEQGITDLDNYTQTDGYGTSMGALAAETCDVATFYADARRNYSEKWEQSIADGGWGQSTSIWEATNVIGVTDPIYNDTISISTLTVDADLKAAIQTAFINIAGTPEGLAVIDIYSHEGYQVAEDADYDNERIAQTLLGNN
jgi:phosphonate transport system substrate-binding protein